jgi:hypothetical protein
VILIDRGLMDGSAYVTRGFYSTMVAGEARYESKSEAKEKDEFLRQAYMGH